ncbi:MAG: hypothetical protein ACYC5O_16840 [Anaerolineae bacterium]
MRRLPLAVPLSLSLLLVALSGCGASGGAGKGAEAVARAWIDALNARDKDKALTLWSADSAESASSVYDVYTLGDRKFPTVRSVVAQANSIDPQRFTDVTAAVVEESSAGKRDLTFEFGMVLEDGKWHITFFGTQ